MALRGGFADPTAPAVVRRRPLDKVLTKTEEREALAWAETRAQQALDFVFGSKAVCGTCHQAVSSGAGADKRYGIVKPRVAERWLPKGVFRHSAHSTETCQRCHALDVTDPPKFLARVKDALPVFADALQAVESSDPVLAGLKAAAGPLKQAPWSPDLADAAISLALVVATEDLPQAKGLAVARRAAEDVVGSIWSDESADILLPGIASCRQCHTGDPGFEWVRPANRTTSDCVTCHYFHVPELGPMRPVAKTEEGPKVPGQYKTGSAAKDSSIKAMQSGIRNSRQ